MKENEQNKRLPIKYNSVSICQKQFLAPGTKFSLLPQIKNEKEIADKESEQ